MIGGIVVLLAALAEWHAEYRWYRPTGSRVTASRR